MTLEIRTAREPADYDAYAELYAAVEPDSAFTGRESRAVEEALGGVHLLAREGDTVVGGGVCLPESHLRDRNAVFGKAVVARDRRRRGVGDAVYRALSAWARERGAESFETRVRETDSDSLAWAQRRGFEERSRESYMELDLTAFEPPAVDPPAGIKIVTWAERPDVVRGMYEVARETYTDIPGSEDDPMPSYDEWLSEDLEGPGDRPEATFVALAGDEVVGYAKFSLSEAQRTRAFHDLTGVKRAWRRRGIAAALKRAEIAWAKAAGYERLVTGNELRNEPIRRLNERLGYRVTPGRVFLRGPLAPTASGR